MVSPDCYCVHVNAGVESLRCLDSFVISRVARRSTRCSSTGEPWLESVDMRIGYPCINYTVGCKSGRTFRLKSYSEDLLIRTVQSNLDCLLKTLEFNAHHNLLFFRISSDLVPFASHPICRFNWKAHFSLKLEQIGNFIEANMIRISMHPDQFTLINSVDEGVFQRSLSELVYHAGVLDSMGLGTSAKVQIHVGGVYGDKKKSMGRFVKRLERIPETVARRLVVENDDRNYTLRDCIHISRETGLPVLFDAFHHEVNNLGEAEGRALGIAHGTWRSRDGIPMVDYSSPRGAGRRGSHAESIDLNHFGAFLEETKNHDFDLMLEIKDKEKSALKAVRLLRGDERLQETATATKS
jgi:UV DNA damage endonuclease